MQKIIIDLDDVLALDSYLNMMNAFFDRNYIYEDIPGYYCEALLNKEELKTYRDYFRNHNVYEYATVAPFSKEVLKDLILYGYELFICSSYYSDIENAIFPELIPYKCEFLMKNYPFLSSKNFMFANDKSLIDGDIRIDDSINNLSGDSLNLLFSAYHNRDLSKEYLNSKNIIRVNDWLEIGKLLIKK